MGKPTGFMDIVDRGYKPVSERISNYENFDTQQEETIKQSRFIGLSNGSNQIRLE